MNFYQVDSKLSLAWEDAVFAIGLVVTPETKDPQFEPDLSFSFLRTFF